MPPPSPIDYATQRQKTIGLQRTTSTGRANHANRRAATRLAYPCAYGEKAARPGSTPSPGLSVSPAKPPRVAFCPEEASAKAVYSYDPVRIASLRATDPPGPLMVDVFLTMRDREKVLGTVIHPEPIRKRRRKIVKHIESARRYGRFNTPDNVLHLAMEYANRFLAAAEPPSLCHSDEAIALACWFLACKFETRYGHPEGKKLVRGTRTALSDLLAAEQDVCTATNYEFSVVTPDLFLEWFVTAFSIAPVVAKLARKVVRKTAHRHDSTRHYPSEVAIAVLEFAAFQLVGATEARALGKSLSFYAGVSEEELGDVMSSYSLSPE